MRQTLIHKEVKSCDLLRLFSRIPGPKTPNTHHTSRAQSSWSWRAHCCLWLECTEYENTADLPSASARDQLLRQWTVTILIIQESDREASLEQVRRKHQELRYPGKLHELRSTGTSIPSPIIKRLCHVFLLPSAGRGITQKQKKATNHAPPQSSISI